MTTGSAMRVTPIPLAISNSMLSLGLPLLLAAVAGCAGASENTTLSTRASYAVEQGTEARSDWAPGARMGVHGMIVFGNPDGERFMSHIPMFHAPHDAQAIMEVQLPGNTEFLSSGLYTFLPDRFSLDDVILGRRTTFDGTLYAGNFEAGGRPLQSMAVVVTRVLHASVLNADAPMTAPRYFMVGSGEERHLLHGIQRAPGFDQILQVSHDVGDTELPSGLWLVATGADDSLEKRLQPGVASLDIEGGAGGVVLFVNHELSVLVGPDFVSGP